MKLKDCKNDDYVILWCIGLDQWDDNCVKIIDNGV